MVSFVRYNVGEMNNKIKEPLQFFHILIQVLLGLEFWSEYKCA